MEAPPIGIMPRKLWDDRRFSELADAIIRYSEAKLRVPDEWLDEYVELFRRKYEGL
jgi:hypothetical protein